ncbi:MAG: ATP-dependent helicase [Myxococcaceae bacterium]
MDLSGLNPEQREAVTTPRGPLLVLAGAGSGKTRVIVHRIAWLLSKGARPGSILAVTFTNKAAAELKERLTRLAGRPAAEVWVSTFHALGAEVARQDLFRLGWPKRFAVADAGDQLALVRRLLRSVSLDQRALDARRVVAAISRAKNSGLPLVKEAAREGDDCGRLAAEAFPLYQRALRAQGAVDFDDLILLPLQLFREHPDVLARWRRRFQTLLVDEFQDTNPPQLEFVRLLAGARADVCAVGDDDQCIYGWRGAEVRNILDFQRHFPGTREVVLSRNYRSAGPVLAAASAVISALPERREKQLSAERPEGVPVQVVVLPGEDDEADWVARAVEKRLEAGLAPEQVAVLYRTNGQSRPLEESLRARGLPFEVLGGTEFFHQREVKDVVAYLKALANPLDEVSLLRIINVPARGIGDATMECLLAHARSRGLGVQQTLAVAGAVPGLSPGAATRVEGFSALLSRMRQRLTAEPMGQVARSLLVEIGFAEDTRAGAKDASVAQARLRGVEGVLASLEAYQSRQGPRADLISWLNRLSLDAREEEQAPERGRVALMTLHAAKGLEFRVVFVVGLEEGLLPHAGMLGEPPNLDEERRLAYVGFTRARDELVLTRAASRLRRGREVLRTPSRFLQDLPAQGVVLSDLTLAAPRPASPGDGTVFARLREQFRAAGAEEPPSA